MVGIGNPNYKIMSWGEFSGSCEFKGTRGNRCNDPERDGNNAIKRTYCDRIKCNYWGDLESVSDFLTRKGARRK